MKRLFAAIHPRPDEEFIAIYRDLKAALSRHSIKWVEEENLHITIMFFGETEEVVVPRISDILHSVTGSHPDFAFRYQGVGIFGSAYHPRVIWVGVEPYEEVSRLIRILKKRLVSIGFPADRQNPVPHLTLGRIRSLQDHRIFQNILTHYQSVSSREMVAGNLILFESVLTRSGPEYRVIQSFPFKK